MRFYLLLLLSLSCNYAIAQTGSIKGRVYNSINNEAIPFANIVVDSLGTGTSSDVEGNYKIDNLKAGNYNVVCSFIGFEKTINYEVIVRSHRATILNIAMIEGNTALDEISITASPFNKTEESPVSLKTVSAEEIYRAPGANRDISKVIQVLPGVASTASFRNDIIVRGGAPNENRFYLDGIEVPNINHFATQGSSGGPVGMINVNFIREVDFYSGAFPANRGNAMSSIIDFKQIEGNDEKLTGTFLVGSSDMGLTLDGPTGDKSAFILSVRRSYLQFLFEALKLPFLPTYNDLQYKHVFNIDEKNSLTLIGLGAIDDFKINKSVNDGVDDSTTIERNNYILGNIPTNSQWNYTFGAKWTHYSKNSYQTLVVSRNHLNNEAIKYKDNIESASNLLLDYNSQEIENKFRLESTKRVNGFKWNIGAGYERVKYTNTTFRKIQVNGTVVEKDFDSELGFNKFNLFSQLSKSFLKKRLTLSVAARTDFSDYSNDMDNPLEQLSPTFSASYALTKKLNANFNTAIYHQLPAYTVLGYRDSINVLTNKNNNINYIQSKHLVAGFDYNPNDYSKLTIESFYKLYDNYPFLLNDSISLANFGGDFGVVGNEPANSTSEGRSYGLEVLLQQKLSSSIYGLISYTYVR
ncbi:MAG: TonB-dependent receptor, partial [Bacteroidia bacterium]|nr:TonB-dependent receptor [Bacteroidia bacterium]